MTRTIELQQTLEMSMQRLDFAAATLVGRPRATISPPSDEPLAADRAALVVAKLRGGSERLVFGEVIAEGGMGVVHTAKQVALDRVVAVKRLRTTKADAKHERALVAEALITGALEHPRVIPIYDMHVDATGAPVLVMTRIEVVFHLKILGEVCDAVHFANSRDVIHRDIKPDNVLIGRFGEVYLADWESRRHRAPSIA